MGVLSPVVRAGTLPWALVCWFVVLWAAETDLELWTSDCICGGSDVGLA
jgi:hypothetical protein